MGALGATVGGSTTSKGLHQMSEKVFIPTAAVNYLYTEWQQACDPVRVARQQIDQATEVCKVAANYKQSLEADCGRLLTAECCAYNAFRDAVHTQMSDARRTSAI
jgi:hypothetical protein